MGSRREVQFLHKPPPHQTGVCNLAKVAFVFDLPIVKLVIKLVVQGAALGDTPSLPDRVYDCIKQNGMTMIKWQPPATLSLRCLVLM